MIRPALTAERTAALPQLMLARARPALRPWVPPNAGSPGWQANPVGILRAAQQTGGPAVRRPGRRWPRTVLTAAAGL